MATIVPTSHTRDTSITTLNHDIDLNFSFPQSQERNRPGAYQFPPVYSSSNVPFSFPQTQRNSTPASGTVLATLNNARPRSSSSDIVSKCCGNLTLTDPLELDVSVSSSSAYTTSLSKPGELPTPSHLSNPRNYSKTHNNDTSTAVLSPTLNVETTHGNTILHELEASETVQIPNLELSKDDDKTLYQKRAPLPPGVNPRRGHAHRRSGAVSSSDVWSLMNQSAPTLIFPSKNNQDKAGESGSSDLTHVSPGNSPDLSWSAPVSPGISPELSDSDSSVTSQRRSARVSFTERVEIIPRPVSSGTESGSTRTVTGHKTSDSIGSFTTTQSTNSIDDSKFHKPLPTQRRHGRTRSNSQTLAQPTAALRSLSGRPSTAGAILLSVPSPTMPSLEIPSISSTKRPSSASPLGQASVETYFPQTLSRKTSHKKSRSDFGLLTSTGINNQSNSMLQSGSGPSFQGNKKKKGKRQIKDWAGNILVKGKQLNPSKRNRKTRSKRAPTPPVPLSEHSEPGENEWVATSWNESYVIMPVDNPPVLEIPRISFIGMNSSPVIDLDVALRPFKAPVEINTGFAAARRRMHSAASRPNGAYMHRRSESMPEMQLFALEEDDDRPMEDVFEETEDDDEDSDESTSSEDSDDDESQTSGDNGLGIGYRTADAKELAWAPKFNIDKLATTSASDKMIGCDTTACLTLPSATSTSKTSASTSPRRKAAPADIITPVNSVQSSILTVTEASAAVVGPSPDSPLTFVTASSNLSTPVQPNFPNDSPSICFDPYRDYLGEPGPEMRLSADDIPSLISSSSTTTMNAVYLGMPSTPSANEMMSMESLCEGGKVKDKDKKDKTKRWSRIWGFWRTK